MKKNALIIGNSDYLYLRKIDSCIYDADAMEEDFELLKFNKVIKHKNLDFLQMQFAIDDFASDYECDSINVIYFSGHGSNFSGDDFIIATNANKTNIPQSSIKLSYIIEKYTKMHAYLIVVIDACRGLDDVETKNFRGVSMQKDVLVAFATQIGQLAYGAKKRNLSPFTNAIHSNILKTNLNINQLFQRIRGQLNNNKYVQMSCEISTMTTELTFTYDNVDKSDKEIYDFIMDSSNGSQLVASIKASELFNKGYLDIMYSFNKVSMKQLFDWKCMLYFSEAEVKALELRTLSQMSGVKCTDNRFFYKDKEIFIGEIPLLPSSLSYQKPIDGDAIDVKIKVFANRISDGIEIKIKCNLPCGMILLVSFPNYSEYSKFVPVTGNYTIINVSEKELGVNDDSFMINISSVSILANSELISTVGKHGRNLSGPYVEFSKIFGNLIQYINNIKIT